MKRTAVLLVLAVAAASSAARAQTKVTLPPPPAPPPGAVERDWTKPGAPPLGRERTPAPQVATTVAPAPARRVAPAPGATHEPQPRHWYGYQTLIVDGLSGLALYGGATGKGDETLVALGVIGYGLGAPLVHSVHGHGGKFWGSFGLRLGMPLGLALMGETACPHNDSCPLAGALIGVAGAIAIDSAVIAREDAPRPTFVVAPAISDKHAGLVVGGTF